jgi:ubiquinone/menaquinone biosynthesis C-methylase UbiE
VLIDETWFALLCESAHRPGVMLNGAPLPAFPPETLQRNTTGKAGAQAIIEAFAFYTHCRAQFARMGRALSPAHSLLDFGCGWGRIARCFIREIPPANIFGIDVTPEFADFCKRAFRSHNFIATPALPPTPIPAERFDFIVAYSVFSHLSPDACHAWMAEFARILTPGGMVAVTTRGRDFFATCENLKGRATDSYSAALAEIFPDFDEARRRYDAGEFVHSNIPGVSGGGAMNASFYGESFISEAYASTAFSKQFELSAFVYEPSSVEQAMLFFRKR